MRRNWLGSAADPLWVASTEMGRGGTGRRKTAVDESRKETTDRVAKYQTDYVGRTGLWYAYGRLLRRPRRCFCCASVFLPFPFALGRIWFILCCSELSVTSPPGGHDTSSLFSSYIFLIFICFFVSFVFFSANASGLLTLARLCVFVALGRVTSWAFSVQFSG